MVTRTEYKRHRQFHWLKVLVQCTSHTSDLTEVMTSAITQLDACSTVSLRGSAVIDSPELGARSMKTPFLHVHVCIIS